MKRIITNIETKNKKIMIEIDGIHHLFLYNSDLNKLKYKNLIAINNEVSDDDYQVLVKHVVNRGKKRIMYLLGKQDYPKSKLEDKLLREGYMNAHIDLILEPFLAKGYIDDQKLARRRLEGFKSYKSKKEIEFKLYNNGFSQEDIKDVISGQFDDEEEFNSALYLLEKRYHLKRYKLEEHELRQKALGFLSRKGYPIDVCFKAYDMFYSQNEDK